MIVSVAAAEKRQFTALLAASHRTLSMCLDEEKRADYTEHDLLS
ncbi:MAG: hypothetical protein ACWGMZ_05610 [Thermoguttaceae bacterium]